MTPGDMAARGENKSFPQEVELKINFAAEFHDDRRLCRESHVEPTSLERLEDCVEEC
jgi:hypothetical protein